MQSNHTTSKAILRGILYCGLLYWLHPAATARGGSILADSIADFGSIQGQNGWYYGYIAPSASPNFVPLPSYTVTSISGTTSPNAWYLASNNYVNIWSTGAAPNGEDGNPDATWPIRRWVSPLAATIQISGLIGDEGTLGDESQGSFGNPADGYDGVIAKILVNGQEVWSKNTTGNTHSTSYLTTASVLVGSMVDFILQPKANDYSDSSVFTAQISIPQTIATWNGSVGKWSDGTRWTTSPISPSNGSPANSTYFVTINGGVVTLDSNIAVDSLTLNGGSLTGNGNLTLFGGMINASYSITGTTTLTGGSLTFGSTVPSAGQISGTGTLQVNADAVLTSNGVNVSGPWIINGKQIIRSGAGNVGTSKVNALPSIAYTSNGFLITYTGTLDLTDNRLIVESSDSADKATKIASLAAAIRSGLNGGTWTGTGITSSSAANDPQHYGLGIFDNAILGLTNFGGMGNVDGNSILVSIAHLGDASDNGVVDIQDQSIVTNHWQHPENNWAAGDLNGDGIVDLQDLTLVTNNWQQTSQLSEGIIQDASSGSIAAVPEPCALGLIGMGLSGLLIKRRRPKTS